MRGKCKGRRDIVYQNIESSFILTKNERNELSHVLHNGCILGGHKMTILSAIDTMCESLKKCYIKDNPEMYVE